MKRCKECGIEKALTDFHKHKNCKDGRRPQCKECRKPKSNQYYVDNKELIRGKWREYYSEHKQQIREYGIKWYESNHRYTVKRPATLYGL